jgi:hypothetical protein
MIIINLKEYDSLVKKVWQLVVDRVIERWLKKSIIFFEWESKRETPVDTGKLRTTYKTEFWKNYWKVLNYSRYGIYLHEWSKPHWVPIKAIEWWAKRHNINPYLVARSISKKWVKARLWITRALEKNKNEPQKIFQEEVQNLLDKLK